MRKLKKRRMLEVMIDYMIITVTLISIIDMKKE
jgi:hypothetical protein